jgi:hypothetical protein
LGDKIPVILSNEGSFLGDACNFNQWEFVDVLSILSVRNTSILSLSAAAAVAVTAAVVQAFSACVHVAGDQDS